MVGQRAPAEQVVAEPGLTAAQRGQLVVQTQEAEAEAEVLLTQVAQLVLAEPVVQA